MQSLKLYMLLLGCKPTGRNTEQHDVFFTIGNNLKDVVPDIDEFWPEAKKNIHLDAWRNVTQVGQYAVKIEPRKKGTINPNSSAEPKLFFINLGGYKAGEFEEFHYKMLVVAMDKSQAILQATQTAFYRNAGIKGAPSHVDDKYAFDVDDVYKITDLLSGKLKDKYSISLTVSDGRKPDEIHLGYLTLKKLLKL